LLEEGLAALDRDDVELRARLLARLAGALRDEPSRNRRDALSEEAVELARRSGNPAALAYALDGRTSAIVAPDTVAERLALGTELREVAESIGDTERVVSAHMVRLIAQLQVGDVPGAEVDLEAGSQVARDLRQPAQLWQVGSSQALLALAAGRLTEADELVRQSLALGERALPTAAIPVHVHQRYALSDFRGGLEEVESTVRALVTEYPARPALHCALPLLLARLGRLPEARRAFDDLARDDFSALPFDQEWLYGMSMLAETCALLRDGDSAAVMYGPLAPWEAANAVDVGEGLRGSVSRYLGLLAMTTERWSDAAQHFENALKMNERMGARPWLAHTQLDYGSMLLARNAPGDRGRAGDLLTEAISSYEELGMDVWAERARGLADDQSESSTRSMR
jgi:tetratricopeptide (TPR) repeat protein